MAFTVVYKLNGRQVTKSEWKRVRRSRKVQPASGAPSVHGATRIGSKLIVSESLAVHPKDAAQAEENARKAGLNVHFRPDGRPEFDSLSKMNAYAKHEGFHHLRKNSRNFY